MEKRKKKKKKHNYVLLCVSDSPAERVKKFKFSAARIKFVKWIFVILFFLLLGYILFTSYQNTVTLSRGTALQQQVDELQTKCQDLGEERDALLDKVAILSETVNQKLDEEKKLEEKNLPTGFPLSGTADMQEMEEKVETASGEEESRPLILFEAGDGVFAVASGAGVVKKTDMDLEYGYMICIDHGNGYETIYRSGTEPKVKEGDEVARNALLFELADDDDNELADQMAYQVIRDGEYIKPTEVLEING